MGRPLRRHLGNRGRQAAGGRGFRAGPEVGREAPILLGEFGAYGAGDMASRARYTAHVARTAESHGWAWAYWQFDSDFIVYDVDRDEWVEPIWKALVPRAE